MSLQRHWPPFRYVYLSLDKKCTQLDYHIYSILQAVQRKTAEIERSALHQARAQNYSIAHPPGSTRGSSGNNSGNDSGSFFEDNFFNRKSNQQQQQQLQIQTQMQEDVDLQALEEQERAIRELENNIVGVNEIYKNLGAMVYEQGVTVDSIESQVEQTSIFVSQGTENLRKASSYRVSWKSSWFSIPVLYIWYTFSVFLAEQSA